MAAARGPLLGARGCPGGRLRHFVLRRRKGRGQNPQKLRGDWRRRAVSRHRRACAAQAFALPAFTPAHRVPRLRPEGGRSAPVKPGAAGPPPGRFGWHSPRGRDRDGCLRPTAALALSAVRRSCDRPENRGLPGGRRFFLGTRPASKPLTELLHLPSRRLQGAGLQPEAMSKPPKLLLDLTPPCSPALLPHTPVLRGV